MKDIYYREIEYGFKFGNAQVERLASDKKTGAIHLSLKTDKEDLQIYVTKTGNVRVFGDSEWTNPKTVKDES